MPAKSIDCERFGSRDSCDRAGASAGCTRRRSRRRSRTGPASRVRSTSTPPTSGPAAAPAADAAPQSVIARICAGPRRGDREQAHPAGEDRRARGALDHPPGDDSACRSSESAISTHEATNSSEAGEEDPPAAEHVAERARGDDHRGADEHVAGDRPLQLRHRRADVLADRRQQDRDRRRVRVDDERRDRRRREDAQPGGAVGDRPRPRSHSISGRPRRCAMPTSAVTIHATCSGSWNEWSMTRLPSVVVPGRVGLGRGDLRAVRRQEQHARRPRSTSRSCSPRRSRARGRAGPWFSSPPTGWSSTPRPRRSRPRS